MKRILGLLTVLVILAATVQAHDIVLRKEGKAVLGISYPSDWQQTLGENHVVAVSSDGQAWSVISTLDGIKDKQVGVAKIKEGLEDYLKDIKYDELTETESGSLIVSGVGKGKKTDVDVVFTAGVFNSGKDQLSGIVFIIDAGIEKYYEKTVLAICKSVLVEEDFAVEEQEVEEKK
ncbi:hypothetical protein CA54_61600 [Symmachiella macrocystis]|uniref:PsbP C-terminal domain-containing protein n=1 Tax=Symmachiella macrocystis TaxID=2527985 RepID=A0A5C6AVJ7_9PLAN|nr:hypothetical protein [Symmachiella macrocystis]TWU03076.1 hypothetical protein CA54_61600 [Symmachiella macrocystis]